MQDQLGALWGEWTDNGSTTSMLTLAFLALGLLTILGSVVVSRTAARRYRSPYRWGSIVTLTIACGSALGILWPASFHFFALGSAVAGVFVAIVGRWMIDRSMSSCHNGHEVAPGWAACPRCERPKAAAEPAPSAARAPIAQAPGQQAQMPSVGTITAARSAPTGGRPDAAQSGPVVVRLIPEDGQSVDFAIHENGALIGRNPDADVVVDDSSASWDHARVVVRDGTASVLDLGSSNGTFVNEELIESSMLISGDRLRVGDTVFQVVS